MKTSVEAKSDVKAACDLIYRTMNKAGYPCSPNPVGCEEQAVKAEGEDEYLLAAEWFKTASAVSLGHSRAERYEAEARRCERLAL